MAYLLTHDRSPVPIHQKTSVKERICAVCLTFDDRSMNMTWVSAQSIHEAFQATVVSSSDLCSLYFAAVLEDSSCCMRTRAAGAAGASFDNA